MATPYATAADAKKEAQVPHALNRLEAALEDAEKSLVSLVSRCGPIQRAVPPDGQSEGKIAEALCPLAERIRNVTDRLNALSNNITGLMSRIEL